MQIFLSVCVYVMYGMFVFLFSFLVNNFSPLEHLINSISADLYFTNSFLFIMLIPWKRKGSDESTLFILYAMALTVTGQ